jgi:hypothetical protein
MPSGESGQSGVKGYKKRISPTNPSPQHDAFPSYHQEAQKVRHNKNESSKIEDSSGFT